MLICCRVVIMILYYIRITEYLSGNREPNDNNLKAVDTPPVPLDERKSATFELYRSLIQRAIGQLYKSSKWGNWKWTINLYNIVDVVECSVKKQRIFSRLYLLLTILIFRSSSAQKSTSSTRSADNVSRFRRFTEMTTPPIQCCQKTTGHSYCSTAATTTKKVKKSCMTKKKFTTKRKSCTTKKKSTKKRKLCTIKKRKSSTSKNKRRSSSTTANNRCPFNDFGTSEHVKHEQNSSAGQPTSTNSHYSNNDINYYY